ncbi:site-specific integrase [Acidiphilium sp.]|uniref:tyrosine-type recombinase/integrase n=1 Tax=Acidiphilium sp. TaxID=527 RepID=UPI002584A5F0|nr:site-specific integrase [Acidiphilium sp.]
MRLTALTPPFVARALPGFGATVKMPKITLSDRFINSPKRVPKAGRADYPDALVPGLALRVSENGHRSFVLIARYPMNPKNPTRRALGDYGELTLEQARDRAREWLALIRKGTDPRVAEARRRADEIRSQVNTFGTVAEAFIERQVSKLAKADEVAKMLRAEFVTKWGHRPIGDILPDEVAQAIRPIAKRAPYSAHNAFSNLRRLFNWAIGTHEFGLTHSPMERLRPRDLIGAREARERILTNDELRAIWSVCTPEGKPNAKRKTDQIGFPYGPLVQMLILTGQRRDEVAHMRWSEIDMDQRIWTIPAGRMKGGRTHVVPLAPEALAILAKLPRFTAGDYVFSTDGGVKPVNGFSKAKARLDEMSGVTGWVLHDLRRTTRTHFSALPVQDLVRELVIAHARPGLHKVYDQHSYIDEKRECLTLWEQRLRGILAPKPPADVASIEAERVRRVGA